MGAYFRNDKKEIARDLETVYESFPRLKERSKQLAGTLSGGEQQMLAMGRAIMSKPKLVVMDEPSMGLSPLLVNEIFRIIKEVSAEARGKRASLAGQPWGCGEGADTAQPGPGAQQEEGKADDLGQSLALLPYAAPFMSQTLNVCQTLC